MADDAKLGILRLPRFPAGWSRTTRTVAALRAILAWYRLFVWGGTFPTLGTVLLLLTQPSRTLAAVSFPVLTGAFAFFHKLLDDELKLRDYRAVYLQDMRFIGWWLAHGGDPCALAKARASTYVPFSTRGQAFLQALGVMHSIGTDQEREFVRHWLMHWIKDVQADWSGGLGANLRMNMLQRVRKRPESPCVYELRAAIQVYTHDKATGEQLKQELGADLEPETDSEEP